ncbi:hypothetical protein F8M49_27865 [Rhodococcus zopfii]|uniref:Uncharacterized protein n=1 Tax=Rhodococcus zopfii TaxID=43772 RepID=A0ABU3WWA8_9NOCA|nr:hypothetical protein [Rhodococcus zopfii]MDV2478270.1 hypothetical protein [Rhodococcus zopfii]
MLTRSAPRWRKPADVPLEIVILWVAALGAAITGVLLVPISQGVLSYYEDGLYGLVLFVFALQAVLLGVTPFGDVRRSPTLIAAGTVIAAAGIVNCFVPDLLGEAPRLLLVVCFGLGGATQLLCLFLGGRFRLWWRGSRELRRLALACVVVYSLAVLVALILLLRQAVAVAAVAVAAVAVTVLTYGVALFVLAGQLWAVDRAFPQQAQARAGDAGGLVTDHTLMLLTGIFLVLLGVLLVPVNLGVLPFSGSAQLGLLMVIFAVEMLASGSTPVGVFPRTWLMIVVGLVFAALGIVSTVIPYVLVPTLTVLIGLLNIVGGVLTLVRNVAPLFTKRDEESPTAPRPPVLIRLFMAQLAMGLLSIAFGAAMLLPGLIPGLVLGLVLAANGGVLLYMLHLLLVVDRQRDASAAPA